MYKNCSRKTAQRQAVPSQAMQSPENRLSESTARAFRSSWTRCLAQPYRLVMSTGKKSTGPGDSEGLNSGSACDSGMAGLAKAWQLASVPRLSLVMRGYEIPRFLLLG